MENKNNNYVKEAFDKIEHRKILLNNRAIEADNYINKFNNFILYNNMEISSIVCEEMQYYVGNLICNILLIENAILANIVTANGSDPNIIFMSLSICESIRLADNNNFSRKFIPSLKDLLSNIFELKKMNRIARRQINNKDIELEKYRKECELKAHEIINNIFSSENMYYDGNVINEEIDKAKSIGNNN